MISSTSLSHPSIKAKIAQAMQASVEDSFTSSYGIGWRCVVNKRGEATMVARHCREYGKTSLTFWENINGMMVDITNIVLKALRSV